MDEKMRTMGNEHTAAGRYVSIWELSRPQHPDQPSTIPARIKRGVGNKGKKRRWYSGHGMRAPATVALADVNGPQQEVNKALEPLVLGRSVKLIMLGAFQGNRAQRGVIGHCAGFARKWANFGAKRGMSTPSRPFG